MTLIVGYQGKNFSLVSTDLLHVARIEGKYCTNKLESKFKQNNSENYWIGYASSGMPVNMHEVIDDTTWEQMVRFGGNIFPGFGRGFGNLKIVIYRHGDGLKFFDNINPENVLPRNLAVNSLLVCGTLKQKEFIYERIKKSNPTEPDCMARVLHEAMVELVKQDEPYNASNSNQIIGAETFIANPFMQRFKKYMPRNFL